VWLRYLAFLIKVRTEAEGVREQAIDNNIWTQEGRKNKTQNESK